MSQAFSGCSSPATANVPRARPISMTKLEELVDSIEATLEESYKQEISSREIGELVMENLHTLDEVAYVRFASVYRQFKDVNQFLNEVNKMIKKQT